MLLDRDFMRSMMGDVSHEEGAPPERGDGGAPRKERHGWRTVQSYYSAGVA